MSPQLLMKVYSYSSGTAVKKNLVLMRVELIVGGMYISEKRSCTVKSMIVSNVMIKVRFRVVLFGRLWIFQQ